MKDRKTLRKTTALLLSLCMIFSLASGCSAKKDKTPEPTDSGVYVPSVSTPPTSVVQKGSDSVFSINYRSEEPINPFLLLSQTNKTVSGLIYEGLFSVNQSFEQEKVLCDDYSTEDGVNFSFSIKQDVLFHDGSKLTANDVLYSLETAKASPLYSERLICIDSLSVADDYTLSITLSYSNRSFPLLLDVPVIKYGQAADNRPICTFRY